MDRVKHFMKFRKPWQILETEFIIHYSLVSDAMRVIYTPPVQARAL
jgi:hypothetical protein